MKEQETSIPSQQYHAGFETYLSPFTYRYGSEEMRSIWSQEYYWTTARRVWIAAAEVQHTVGLVNQEELNDLIEHRNDLSVERIFEFENKIGHDVGAAIEEFTEKAQKGGGSIHNAMTSEDILSNVEAIQIHQSFALVKKSLIDTLDGFSDRIVEHKNLVCMGYTHIQAAEPTTYGYRFAKYAQDLLEDFHLLNYIQSRMKGKGIKGAVGTSASFEELLKGTGMSAKEHEEKIMEKLGIGAATITDQTYPRKFLLLTETVLSNIGQSLHRFALDLQYLQSSPVGEISEPRKENQIGSSSMPWKENPKDAENICSIIEELPGVLLSSWTTASFITLERTLRDSAGKRSWLPESFLRIDEVLKRAEKIIRGLVLHENAIAFNLNRFAPFCTSEIILARLTKAGMNRNLAYQIIKAHGKEAVDKTRSGMPNPIKDLILSDERITQFLKRETIEEAFIKIYTHVGEAPQRCIDFLQNELYPAIKTFTSEVQ